VRLPLSRKPDPKILTEETRIRAGIGVDHWDTRVHRVPDRCAHKKTIRDYIRAIHVHDADGLGLVLYGHVESGKTSLGSIVLRNALARGARVFSIRCRTMINRLLSKHPGKLPLSEIPLMQGLLGVNFLMIDEYTPDPMEWKQALFEEVVASRCADRKPTIVTTNIDKDELFQFAWFRSRMQRHFLGVDVVDIHWRESPPVEEV